MAGCSEGPAAPQAKDAERAPLPVSVVSLTPAPLAVVRELPGRIAPTRIAQVRARVSGIVIRRNFEQGSEVREGDVLYEIDPRPFEIELRAAEAALAKARAAFDQESRNAARMQALAPKQAISQSQLDAAVASQRQAEADVSAREADVARAKLNLSHTIIRAPIHGRIGRALVTEGALVSQSDLTHMATIQQLSPIYADFTQSVAELNQLRREFESGDLKEITPSSTTVRLVLDNGEIYPYEGRLLFSDTTVDPGTGQVTLRGEFPNPKLALLPGMYIRVQIEQGIDPDAIAVPQQAVRRTETGESELFVVRDDNRASLLPVKLGRAVNDRWMILDGVKPGDRVIVDGFQKFAPGDLVTPKPWRNRSAEQQLPHPQRSADATDGHVTAR
jgi:membrane fusion protein (multidrug efflux system)